MILRFLFVLLFSACNPSDDELFIDKVISNFDWYSFFLSVTLKDKTKYLIKNDDLYYYLQGQKTFDKEQYKEEVKSRLTRGSAFDLLAHNLNPNFIKVQNVPSVEANAKMVVDEFVKMYFDNDKTIKAGISDDEKTAIIQKLIEWKIAIKIDDETGYLIISR